MIKTSYTAEEVAKLSLEDLIEIRKAVKSKIDNTTILSMPFTNRVKNVLTDNNIHFMCELYELSALELWVLPFMTPSLMDEIKLKLKEVGMPPLRES